MKNKTNLVKKWKGLLNENSLKHKEVISNLLENSYIESGYRIQEEELNEEGVQSSFIDAESYLIKPVVEGVVANSVAKELVHVYELTKGPVGTAYAFDYYQAPTDNNLNGNVYVGNTASLKYFPTYSQIQEGEKPAPIKLKVLDMKLDAKNGYERKVLFELTEELKQDIKSQMDSDTAKIISNALSSEVSIGVDYDVLEFTRNNSTTVDDFVWTISSATERSNNPAQKLESKLLGEIGEFSGRSAGMASAIVITPKLIAAFALMNKFQFDTTTIEEETASVLLKIGKLGSADVFVNSVTIVDNTGVDVVEALGEEILIFKKASKKGTFAGTIYAPYDFRILKPATNPDTFAEVHSLIHRYDIKQFANGDRYYKKFYVTGITASNYPYFTA